MSPLLADALPEAIAMEPLRDLDFPPAIEVDPPVLRGDAPAMMLMSPACINDIPDTTCTFVGLNTAESPPMKLTEPDSDWPDCPEIMLNFPDPSGA